MPVYLCFNQNRVTKPIFFIYQLISNIQIYLLFQYLIVTFGSLLDSLPPLLLNMNNWLHFPLSLPLIKEEKNELFNIPNIPNGPHVPPPVGSHLKILLNYFGEGGSWRQTNEYTKSLFRGKGWGKKQRIYYI